MELNSKEELMEITASVVKKIITAKPDCSSGEIIKAICERAGIERKQNMNLIVGQCLKWLVSTGEIVETLPQQGKKAPKTYRLAAAIEDVATKKPVANDVTVEPETTKEMLTEKPKEQTKPVAPAAMPLEHDLVYINACEIAKAMMGKDVNLSQTYAADAGLFIARHIHKRLQKEGIDGKQ